MTIGEMCKAYRRKHLLTQASLAKMCGVSVATISKCEHGHPISLLAEGCLLKLFGGDNNGRDE